MCLHNTLHIETIHGVRSHDHFPPLLSTAQCRLLTANDTIRFVACGGFRGHAEGSLFLKSNLARTAGDLAKGDILIRCRQRCSGL